MNKKNNKTNSKIKYISSDGKINGVRTIPAYTFLSGAEHHKLDKRTGVWHPSDEAVEEMREFCQEHRL